MSLGALLAAKKGVSSHNRKIVRTDDFLRISALARRGSYLDLSEAMTEVYKTSDGNMSLWPIQAIAMAEAFENNGLLACIRVGGGKSLLSQLLPQILEAERPLLLVPAQLKKKTLLQDLPQLRDHWNLHPKYKVWSYSELSSEAKHDALLKYQPDLIVADECHYLRNPGAGRTRRFLRYFKHFPDTKFCGLSGTITKRSIRDYWHLVRLALKNGSPLPLIWTELNDWADALDEGIDETKRVQPGALLDFCNEGETVRDGYRRRFVETPGIVTTEEGAIGTTLIIQERELKSIPIEIHNAFVQLRSKWCTPGGEEITDALSMNRHSKELSVGFYYKWIWPNDEPDYEWLDARRDWKRFVRQTIKTLRKNPFDTELQVAKACASKELISNEYELWKEIKNRVSPITHPVWISEYIVDEIENWLKKNKGIVWIEHQALGHKLTERGIKYYGSGDDGILDEKDSFAASIHAHGTGKNLQRYSKNFFVCVPSAGSIWEQTLGRTHRPGQEAEEVNNDILLHTKELWSSFWQARRDASYIEATTGQKQKLQYADILVTDEDTAMNKMLYSLDPLWCLPVKDSKDNKDTEDKQATN